MRLYFCHIAGERRGLYVIASSRKKAVYKYARSVHRPYRSIEASPADIDIDSEEEECMVYPGSIIAQEYGIEYTSEQRRG